MGDSALQEISPAFKTLVIAELQTQVAGADFHRIKALALLVYAKKDLLD